MRELGLIEDKHITQVYTYDREQGLELWSSYSKFCVLPNTPGCLSHGPFSTQTLGHSVLHLFTCQNFSEDRMLQLIAKMRVGDYQGFQLSCLFLTSTTKDNQKVALAIF